MWLNNAEYDVNCIKVGIYSFSFCIFHNGYQFGPPFNGTHQI